MKMLNHAIEDASLFKKMMNDMAVIKDRVIKDKTPLENETAIWNEAVDRRNEEKRLAKLARAANGGA